MRKLRKMSQSLLMVVLVLIVIIGIETFAEQSTDKPDITVKDIKSQTVLYTIYRGNYEKIGDTISKLYALAIKNEIWPRGSLSCVYLNNVHYISHEHCLVEIRIPVSEDSLKHAGKLGEMTDVKTVNAMEAAVMIKPAGNTNYDYYAKVFDDIYAWIAKHNYSIADDAYEIFATDSGTTDYSQVNSEIMVPVFKISQED